MSAEADRNLVAAKAMLTRWREQLAKATTANETARMTICVAHQAEVVAFWEGEAAK